MKEEETQALVQKGCTRKGVETGAGGRPKTEKQATSSHDSPHSTEKRRAGAIVYSTAPDPRPMRRPQQTGAVAAANASDRAGPTMALPLPHDRQRDVHRLFSLACCLACRGAHSTPHMHSLKRTRRKRREGWKECWLACAVPDPSFAASLPGAQEDVVECGWSC